MILELDCQQLGNDYYIGILNQGSYTIVSISRGVILSGPNPFGFKVLILRSYIVQSFAVVGALLCSLGQAGARAPARQQVQSVLFLTSGLVIGLFAGNLDHGYI